MTLSVRPAGPEDLDVMVDLLVADGAARQALDPVLWKMAPNAAGKVRNTLRAAMENAAPSFRQQWLLAEQDGVVVGLSHSILLPVPPIYAGEFGPPGLLMEDCCLAGNAPENTVDVLLEAAEADLRAAGAEVLLGSSAAGGVWGRALEARGYHPLTLYFARVGLRAPETRAGVRKATDLDLPGIVVSSAANRQLLNELSDFWKPHDTADARFGAWMEKSLTLTDRDMFVSETDDGISGYAISHPATPLHFPAPHDIGGIGVIDDYFHEELRNPAGLAAAGSGAADVLHAAEAALQARGREAALVVCPAKWASKIAVLEQAGYANAITWYKADQKG